MHRYDFVNSHHLTAPDPPTATDISTSTDNHPLLIPNSRTQSCRDLHLSIFVGETFSQMTVYGDFRISDRANDETSLSVCEDRGRIDEAETKAFL